MDKNLCEKFEDVWEVFPEELTSDKNYQLKKGNFLESYCYNDGCEGNLDKINAGFFYLLNKFFGSSGPSYYAENNINVVDYTILWLSYMLTLKENEFKNSIQHFYTTFINNNAKYKSTVENVKGCSTFKDIIDKRHNLMNKDMDKNMISTLHDAFKLLCKMYTDFDEDTSNCKKCSEKANDFVEKYKNLKNYYSIPGNDSYNKMLSTLSTDYNKLKDKCNDTLSFPSIETIQSSEQKSGFISEVASSSSSITNKLISVLSIFGVIGFLLGISYKYSLFGFRKRFQKQKLREKLKNIKKKMNH
ncbi:hypothetical protein YYC_05073 [Plasmodium yoelii 17X]|uniref:PIR protein n=4 Tax=Plasmodium yoelii TaxID=5861 RepID=A0AAF0B050_PLAYO|nr:PIR protein [Plasmodium yoelii]EAA16635.1 putative yir4 protein [Plasmodium yoelii yoelii]ETB57277.1 hypothetical protein YYC_05073 [Plasmodium yoelii 17X]WBY55123.1 PIR protein [Plasmodium yoelii yoelii]CDU16376.1 YIR protein [Plasmodium yoelii]VTZ72709.1 PIR protein [Plasmodium yoelii]|eukprot:XP_022811503.1 PIR protein [Plasmodium yoelii]